MVIVGIDSRDPDPLKHYLLVKNSYGEKWGDGGFSRIGFEAIYFLIVPYFYYDEIKQLQAEDKAKVVDSGNDKNVNLEEDQPGMRYRT